MKIIKIEFCNINSLKGNHQIDFTAAPFTASSLFAITGPTGSGKSTILDVVSLALFNKIPRLERISKGEILKTGAIITRNQQEAMAAVTYEGKKGRFRSEWNISTARTGNLREYDMQLSKVETGELIDLKKSEVPSKNEELIGLNYNQFIKSVLLAQGEFAQFLKAKKDERGELLEKITGTGIYRQLGRKSYEKFKEANKEIEAQQHRISAIKEQLLDKGKHASHSENLKQKDCDVKELEKKIESLNKQVELKKKITNQLREVKTQQNLNQIAKEKLDEFNAAHGFALKQHEKIEASAEDLRTWSQWKKEIQNFKAELETIRKNEQQNEANRKACLQNAEKLVNHTVIPDEIIKQLEAFGKKINLLQQERREIGQEYTSIKKQLQRELQGLPFQLKENLEESKSQLKNLGTQLEEKILTFRRKLEDLDLTNTDKEKKQLSAKLQMAQEAWRKDTEIKTNAAEIEKLKTEEEQLFPKLTNYPVEIQAAKNKTELLRERLEKFELKRQNQLLQATLEEHRHHLKEGAPCPLCGALDHPYIKDLPKKDDSLEMTIQENRKELDVWKNKLNTAQANLRGCEDRVEKLQQQQRSLENKLKTQKQEFTNSYGHLCPGETNPNWEKMCHNWQEQVEQIQALQDEQERYTAIKTGLPLLEQLQNIFLKGTKLKQNLQSLYSGEDIAQDTGKLITTWIGLYQEHKNISGRIEEIEKKIAENSVALEQLETDLLPTVQQQGFNSIENAREALINEAECKKLRLEKEEIQKQVTSTKSSLALLHSQLIETKKADVAEEEEVLDNSIMEGKQKLAVLSGECRELYSLLKNHADNLKRLKDIQSNIFEKEKQVRRWRLLNELIGDATGKKFNDFAQDLSLGQLLQLANVRLKDLSDRYSIDKPKKDEDDGLVAIDEHMGGQRRSVKTLSGGETFILSLSMALALSDLASKNVEINSLFIDEGFGTLDPETLDQTLDTLEKLQAESAKTIGIISHVDSLKERIATQIQLKRNGQGYSQLEIK